MQFPLFENDLKIKSFWSKKTIPSYLTLQEGDICYFYKFATQEYIFASTLENVLFPMIIDHQWILSEFVILIVVNSKISTYFFSQEILIETLNIQEISNKVFHTFKLLIFTDLQQIFTRYKPTLVSCVCLSHGGTA